MKNSLRFLFLLALLTSAPPVPAAVLFDRADANWRWRPGTNEASAPVMAWRNLGFNDSEFVTAPAPFWYGDVLPAGTQIAGMQNVYLSIFLRKTFVLASTNDIAALRLGSLVDDGYVAWINGVEVVRVSMPEAAGAPVTITNLAVNAPEPPPFNLTNLLNPSSYLVVGANVLAVQVFQSALNSSDLGFDASLETILLETVPPTVQGANPVAGGTVGGLASVTVTFSEAVSGVDAADFLINGAAALAVTPGSSSVYTFSFPQPAYGAVLITWAVGHGITDQAVVPNAFNATGPGATWQYTLVDSTPPTVATLSPAPNETVRYLTNITVLFSENVTGVDAGDLRINNTPASGVAGAADTYTFSFTQPLTGLVQLAWAVAPGITDQAAVPNAFAPGAGWFYTLDPNAMSTLGPVISEFMASSPNLPSSLKDEFNEASDWIEVQNLGSSTVNMLNWSLTDEADNLDKWRFPSTNLPPGGLMIVFASERNIRVSGGTNHTNFKLDGTGDYLALVRPDGSIASEFAPTFAPQVAGVSYGLGVLSTNATLVSSNTAARVRIPANGNDGTNWLYTGFNDGSWTAGTNGVGFGTTNVTQADYTATVLPTSPLNYWRLDETSGTVANNLGSSGDAGDATYLNSPTLGAAGPRPPALGGFEPNNNAVQLSGTAGGDYVAGPSGLMNGRAAFTMAGWIRPTAAQAARTGLFGQNDCVEFGFISAGQLQAYTAAGTINFAYPFPDNEWHHVAVIGAGGQIFLYLDGTQRATSAGSAGSSAFTFNIGGGGVFDATANDFVGQIDEVGFWDRALSASEMLGLYSAGTNLVGVAAVKFARTDVGPAMSNINASAYVRLPFTIDDPSNVQLVTLRMRYDDGFVAYLNGVEVARASAPAGTPAFNATATAAHAAASVTEFKFGAALLRAGANVLAIQGLNQAVADEDFLVSAELISTHAAASSSGAVYFTVPSPGLVNGTGTAVLGPTITEAAHAPNVPTDAQDLLVTVKVAPSFASIGSVVVRYRIMFGTESEVVMLDDGQHGDGLSGDGVYGATLPISGASTNGQMIRWYFRATDSLARVSRWPLFPTAVDEEYLGTVVDPSYVTSKLPIFHLFVAPGAQTAGMDTEAGGRLAMFYDGEFYDNMYMELRGNTSAGLAKKAHRLEFNRDHKFRHPGPGGRVRKSSLLAEYIDPSYLRQHLSFWFMDKIGVPSPFDYPVRVQTNGAFYQLAFHNDVIGQDQVERMGYDPRGALYKAVGNVLLSRSSTGVFQKLEPDEPVATYTDYNQLANGIVETAAFAVRRAAVFDLLDVPEVINHLAGVRWCSENDDVWANMSMYRDTFGDQLWRCIPFDMNASWGQRYGGVATLEASVDTQKSHPLYGGRAITPAEGGAGYNRIYDVISSVPEAREMLLRRMRTIMDKMVQPPGTPSESLIIENYIKQMTNLMVVEANLDRAKWGNSPWGPVEAFMPACSNVMMNFVAARRTHWYVTHNIGNNALVTGTNSGQKAGIPNAQPVLTSLSISNVDFNPSSGNQAQEYIQIRNDNGLALDISDWRLDGAVQFKFKPGTVIPSNSVLYVSPNVVAFKARGVSPRGGEGNFVVGPYQGQLNARGETLYIYDHLTRPVTSNTYVGAPSLAQQYLRVTEIMYNPAPLAGNTNDAQEFEYLELKNISGGVTLNLANVRLTNGVDFNFSGSAVTSLAPGARVVVVRNAAAFAARYGAVANIAGQFTGSLDNAGEVIRLDDATGEKVLEFDYNNTWYPITDGLGFSLVIADETAAWDTSESEGKLAPSGSISGAPGSVDPVPPGFAPIAINEVLSHTDLPLVDTIELFNPTLTNVNIGGWYLSDDATNVTKYRFPNPTIIPGGGYLVVDESQFNATPGVPPSFALRSLGDEVFLLSGDPATPLLTGYLYGFDFGASDTGVSFGRHVNSVGKVRYVAQSVRTLGAANAAPKVGPIAIAEIMYHPPDFADGSDNSQDEYIELLNLTGAGVPLFDPAHATNTWHVRGGAKFDFPTGQTLAANGSLLLVNFDPADVVKLATFRGKYGVGPAVPVFGPYSGKLGNDADDVKIEKPGDPAITGVPYILVDRVEYEDKDGWSAAADGTGASLQKLNSATYGNDPANWTAASPSASSALPPGSAPVILTQPASTTAFATLSASFSVSATGSAPLRFQWRFNGGVLPGATNSLLTLNSIDFSKSGQYSVNVYNNSGSAVSSNATLSVLIPAVFLLQPQPVSLRGSTNLADYGNTTNLSATFTAQAVGTGPVGYQWRFNGVNIVGATSGSYTVSNVQLTNDGVYDVLATDEVGTIPSAPARLSVLITPMIIQAPLAQTLPAGSRANLSVAIIGNPPPFGYQWRSNSYVYPLIVSNSRTNYVSLPTATNAAAATFRVVVTNAASPGNGVVSQFTITTILDTDLDGIADLTEIALGLNPNNPADAAGDLDGDRMSNVAEIIAGTDPNDATKYLRVELTAPGIATVQFNAVTNRTYSVQYTDVLPLLGGATWTKLGDVLARTNNRVETVIDPAWTTNRFYRLVIPSQP